MGAFSHFRDILANPLVPTLMSTDTVSHQLDDRPDADTITSLRAEAREQGASVQANIPMNETTKRLVVSPRGTVVLLNDVSEETFNASHSAEDIAAALNDL